MMDPNAFSSVHARRLLPLAVATACLLVSGCGNPLLDDQIDFLGEEDPEVGETEFHRPGQPCVVCHGPYEGAEPEMAVAGTIFADSVTKLPVGGVTVILTDAIGVRKTAKTNCIGNFWITTEDWDPQFPLATEIRYPVYDDTGAIVEDAEGEPQRLVQTMASYVTRDRSCATCHTLEGRTLDSTGWIFCNAPDDPNPVPFPDVPASCNGKPPR